MSYMFWDEEKEFKGSPIFKEMEKEKSFEKLLHSTPAKRENFAWLIREEESSSGFREEKDPKALGLIVDFVAFRTVGEGGEWLTDSVRLDLKINQDSNGLYVDPDILKSALAKVKAHDVFGRLTFDDKERVKPSVADESSDKYSERRTYIAPAPGGPS